MLVMSETMTDKNVAIVMDKKEAQALILIIAAAIKGEKLNKRSTAYKIAMQIDGDLPCF